MIVTTSIWGGDGRVCCLPMTAIQRGRTRPGFVVYKVVSPQPDRASVRECAVELDGVYDNRIHVKAGAATEIAAGDAIVAVGPGACAMASPCVCCSRSRGHDDRPVLCLSAADCLDGVGGDARLGAYAYLAMPQRHDPDITVGTAVVVTAYPGACAEKVEQELTRKIEKRVNENPAVERVRSISRQGLSVVFVELRDEIRQADQIWRICRRTAEHDRPAARDGQPVQPRLDKEFGDTTAGDAHGQQPACVRLRNRAARGEHSGGTGGGAGSASAEYRDDRVTAVLVYPTTVARSYVLWIGNNLRERLLAKGLAEDAVAVEPLSTGCWTSTCLRGGRSAKCARKHLPGNAIRLARAWRTPTSGPAS